MMKRRVSAHLAFLCLLGFFSLSLLSRVSPIFAQETSVVDQSHDHDGDGTADHSAEEHDHDHPNYAELLASVGGTAEDEDKLDGLKKRIEELQNKISGLKGEQNTLSSAIAVLDSQIQLNETEIEKTQFEISLLERQIDDLGQRIEGLEMSLADLSKLLVNRIQRQYKQAQADPVALFFASTGLTEFVKEQRYVQQARAHTEDLMVTAEYKRQVYDEEKSTKEEKQHEMEALRSRLSLQQGSLNEQKKTKQSLLDITRNDERVYQQQLAAALAEYQAIQSIVAGGGDESKVKSVKKGDNIASIIPSASPCSTGAHLHFEVVKSGVHMNPANYLRSTDTIGVSLSYSGSWDWPLSNPARITQGYGMTEFAKSGFYGGGGHTGIDMLSKTSGSWAVKAVKDGELYRGSIRCGGGYLKYVRVKHDDDISSYYLHVNY